MSKIDFRLYWRGWNLQKHVYSALRSHLHSKAQLGQHFWATCTQKNSLRSTSDPPGAQKCISSSTSDLLKHTKAQKWQLKQHFWAAETCKSSKLHLKQHFCDSIGLSSDSLIFPSESLCCFELCFRIDSAQFWLTYLSFGVAVLLRNVLSNRLYSVLTHLSFLQSRCAVSNCAFESTVLSSDFLIFPSVSLHCFELYSARLHMRRKAHMRI